MRTDALRILLFLLIAASAGCFALRKPSTRASNDKLRLSSVTLTEDDTPPRIDPPPMPNVPAKTTAASKDESSLRRLANRAVEAERKLETYNVRLRKRERLKDVLQPTELLMVKYRRTPYSVHFKWLGETAQGREILYVKGQYEGKVQILTGRGDLLGPGLRVAFAPDSAIVRSRFQYDVQEAGLNAGVNRFAAAVDAVEKKRANAGTLDYLGRQLRPEFPTAMEAAEHKVPAGVDPVLTQGGIRRYYFDEASGLPLVIQSFDAKNAEVEYYCFDRLQTPVALDDADFDPALLWPKRK